MPGFPFEQSTTGVASDCPEVLVKDGGSLDLLYKQKDIFKVLATKFQTTSIFLTCKLLVAGHVGSIISFCCLLIFKGFSATKETNDDQRKFLLNFLASYFKI